MPSHSSASHSSSRRIFVALGWQAAVCRHTISPFLRVCFLSLEKESERGRGRERNMEKRKTNKNNDNNSIRYYRSIVAAHILLCQTSRGIISIKHTSKPSWLMNHDHDYGHSHDKSPQCTLHSAGHIGRWKNSSMVNGNRMLGRATAVVTVKASLRVNRKCTRPYANRKKERKLIKVVKIALSEAYHTFSPFCLRLHPV